MMILQVAIVSRAKVIYLVVQCPVQEGHWTVIPMLGMINEVFSWFYIDKGKLIILI